MGLWLPVGYGFGGSVAVDCVFSASVLLLCGLMTGGWFGASLVVWFNWFVWVIAVFLAWCDFVFFC